MTKRSMVDFERGIGAAESHAAGPVRVIPVTPAMRDADTRRRAQQAAAGNEWRKSLGFRPAVEVESRISTCHVVKQPKRQRSPSVGPE